MVLLNVFLVGRCGSSTSNASSSALLSSLRRGVASAAASQHEPACRYDTSSVCVHGSASEACALPSTSAAGVQLAEWRREAWASSRHVRRAPAGMYALFSGCSRRWTAQHVRELASHAHDHSGHSHLEQDCWSCQHRFRKGGLVCTGCEKIQPIDKSMNYFQLLGVPNMKYELDLRLLDKRYKQLQWSVHPDRLAKHTPQEREFSADSASMVNMAYQVLRDPLSRANYLLAQHGISAEGDDRTISDPKFLMEVMEAREEVEETEDEEALRELLAANRERQQQVIQELSAAFASAEGIQTALELAGRLAYMARVESKIMEKLPSDSGVTPSSGAVVMD